jgi:peptidoglycan/LPS O-acetylase OafA/YrhL
VRDPSNDDPAGAAPRLARLPDAIDLLKAYAILGVLWQHTVPRDVTATLLGNLWIRPAVPIFLILLGLNLESSLRRRGLAPTWSSLRVYLARRLDRLVLPFVLIAGIAYVIAGVRGDLRLTTASFLGGLPLTAPGNYFITALFGLVALFPLLHWAYARWPRTTIAGAFLASAGFEWLAVWTRQHGIGLLQPETLAYQGNPARYLALVVLGIWLADRGPAAIKSRLLLAASGLSACYLLVEQFAGEVLEPLAEGFTRQTNAAAAPWALLLVLIGLHLWGRQGHSSRRRRAGITLGRASYHVYLVQMLWTGVITTALWGGVVETQVAMLAVAPTNWAACIALGLLYWRLVPHSHGVLPGRAGRTPQQSGDPGRLPSTPRSRKRNGY